MHVYICRWKLFVNNFRNFAGASLNNGNISLYPDNLALEMDKMYEIIGRAAANKPLWIGKTQINKLQIY